MSSRSLSQLAILTLLLVGGVWLLARHNARQAQQTAIADSVWELTYELTFKSAGDATQVQIALPQNSDTVEIEGEPKFIHPGLRPDRKRLVPSGTRVLYLSPTHLDEETLTATSQFRLRLRPGGGFGKPAMSALSGDTTEVYLRAIPTDVPKNNPEVRREIAKGQEATASEEELLQWVFDYCAETIRFDPKDTSDDVIGTLADKAASALGKARLMVTLCRAGGLPARLVTGFELRQATQARPVTWVEVFRDKAWVPFDPANGWARYVPPNYVAVRREGKDGRHEIVKKKPRDDQPGALTERYSITRMPPDEAVLLTEKRRPSQVFDLTRLPVEMHEVLSLLLLLPLGALITAFFRNIVGIPTFGTFAPALFAVSFIYADWGSGLVILAVVLVAGSLGRALVGRLRLLMVPRLSIILTSIILCVVFGVSALDYLELTPSANAVLLPLVIVTILIERLYVTIEEDGAGFAIQLAAGTLLVSAICYLVLGWDEVGKAILVYPEAHLITMALFIAIGRYAGYRLIEMWRFRDLVGQD